MEELLGDDAELLLDHRSETLDKANLHLPGPDFVDRVFLDSDRSTNVLRQLQWLIHSGRLSGTGYVSILPIDQGIEHSAARRSRPTRSTSIPTTSSSSRWRAAATRSPRRSACSAR